MTRAHAVGVLPLLAVVTAMTIVPPSAAAECTTDGASPRTANVEAVFLGVFEDLLGHRASFYFDPRARTVIGPVDHDPWPGDPPATGLASTPPTGPGTIGTVTIKGYAKQGEGVTDGRFAGWTATRRRVGVGDVVPRIEDPVVIGLLAPTVPAAEAVLDTWRVDPAARAKLDAALMGVLYAARGARAQTMLAAAPIPPHGARFDRVATLRDGGLAALGQLAADPAKDDWTDYLPELAAAWLARHELTSTLDDLLLRHGLPYVPIDLDPQAPVFQHRCLPARHELRGPFASYGELRSTTIRLLAEKVDPAFGAALVPAFANVSVGLGQYVVGTRGKTVFVTGLSDGMLSMVAVSRPVPLGAKLSYVARGPASTFQALAHLDDNGSQVIDAGTASRLAVGKVDVRAMLGALQTRVSSERPDYAVAPALIELFNLAGKVPGWRLADARAFAWSLPGTEYWSAAGWSTTLRRAIREAPDATLAAEVERALPTLIARLARGPTGGDTAPIDAAVVRTFITELTVDIVARRLIARDLAGAARSVALAKKPLAAIAPRTKVTAETTPDATERALIATLDVLVSSLRRAPVTLPAEAERRPGRDKLFDRLRGYAPAIRDPWFAALVAAGYPAMP